MNHRFLFPVLALFAVARLSAQEILRPAPSGRSSTAVELTYPQPTGTMAAMPGMAPATARPSTTAASSGTAASTRTATAAPATVAAPAMSATSSAPPPKPFVIRIDYGQPHLRGRQLHTDSLVPYDKPWRTGAGESTKLTTDVDFVLGGKSIPKGSYVLYTLPGKTAWKLIVQRSVGQSAMAYADSNDVARIDLRRTTLPYSIESFTMWLIPSRDPGPAKGELRFSWGNDQLSTDWSVK